MLVMVTGNLGYIGTALCGRLKREGMDVIGLDSDLYRRCTFGAEPDPVPTIRKDIRDVTVDDLTGVDAICHLAGLSNDPLGFLDPDLTYAINYRASVDLAEKAREAGVRRYVFSSSCSNYGAGGQDWLDETSAFRPVTPYGESKVLTEQAVGQMATDRFSPTFLRNATVYGVTPRIRFDLVLNNLVAWAVTTGKIMLKSDGSPWRPIVHVDDVARAFVAVLKAPRELVHNEAFNVGRTEENFRIRDLATIVGETVPDCVVTFAEGAEPDTRCYRVNCDKLPRRVPAFQPRWNARMGAKQLYEAYRRVGLTLAEFEGPRYQRLGHIRMLITEGVLDGSLRVLAEHGAAVAGG